MSMGKVCNRDVVCAHGDMTVQEAAMLMRHQHVGDVVIVESDRDRVRPIGIITDRDIVVEVVAKKIDPANVTVGDIMSRDLALASEGDGIFHAIQLMRTKGVRRIPVVNDDGMLIGIACVDDLLELLAEEMTVLSKIIPRELAVETRLRS